jgi:hypothetical protein
MTLWTHPFLGGWLCLVTNHSWVKSSLRAPYMRRMGKVEAAQPDIDARHAAMYQWVGPIVSS